VCLPQAITGCDDFPSQLHRRESILGSRKVAASVDAPCTTREQNWSSQSLVRFEQKRQCLHLLPIATMHPE
jgi:hypothetical protein